MSVMRRHYYISEPKSENNAAYLRPMPLAANGDVCHCGAEISGVINQNEEVNGRREMLRLNDHHRREV